MLESTSPRFERKSSWRRVFTSSVFEEAAYIRHVNSSSLLINDSLAVHDCPSSMNTSINSPFFLNSFSDATFSRPEKALTESQPVKAWYPIRAYVSLSPNVVLFFNVHVPNCCFGSHFLIKRNSYFTRKCYAEHENICIFRYNDDRRKTMLRSMFCVQEDLCLSFLLR